MIQRARVLNRLINRGLQQGETVEASPQTPPMGIPRQPMQLSYQPTPVTSPFGPRAAQSFVGGQQVPSLQAPSMPAFLPEYASYRASPQWMMPGSRVELQQGGRTADGLDLPDNSASFPMTEYGPRVQGAVLGRGTDTSDNIAAALSPNEFVMTARAVRGAGNGDLNRGIAAMYDLMQRLERRGGGTV